MKALKEKAKELRQELKAEGIKASVVMRSGSAIQVYLKDLAIDKDRVKEIAKKYENIHRCEYTFEILSGGNDYVFVDYDHDILRAASKNYEPMAAEIIENRSPRYCHTIAVKDGKTFLFFPGENVNMDEVRITTDEVNRGWAHGAYNAGSLATALAIIDNVHGLQLV